MRLKIRALCAFMSAVSFMALTGICLGDSSSPNLASYYDRHMAIINDAAFGWTGANKPRHMLDSVKQVGVSNDSFFALKKDGTLLQWSGNGGSAKQIASGVSSFSAGQRGVFVIDTARGLWHIAAYDAPVKISDQVLAASIGDGTDYYITTQGSLFVKGNAHRGQYGDGLLRVTADFIQTAEDAVDVKAHTGHALYLSRNGDVMGTGGNIYGPLSAHGLGDKATRWGTILTGAKSIATGASHSAAIRHDQSLWIWGAGYGPAPRKILENVTAVAAGSRDTIAATGDGALWQWEAGSTPRRLPLSRD